MANTVFYFSGTGNSLMTARSLADKLGDTRVVALAGLQKNAPLTVDSDVVVFVFPVYAGGIPLIVSNSLKSIRFTGNPYVAAIATCGGAACSAIGIFAASLADVCGVELSAGWELVMPGNYTPLYGAYSDRKNAAMLSAAETRLAQLAALVRDRRSCSLETLAKPLSLPVEMLWHGFSRGVGRCDKYFRVLPNCTGCGICQKVCPVGNIRLTSAARPVWQHKCEQCMACLQFCPVEAIQMFWWTQGRRRYRHPQVTAAMIAAQKQLE